MFFPSTRSWIRESSSRNVTSSVQWHAFSAAQPCLNVYEFEAGGRLASRRRIVLDAPCSVHDFAITSRYAVFYVSPYLLDLASLLGEGRTTMESLRWQPDLGSRLLVVARDSGTPDRVGRSYHEFWMLGISRAGRPGRKFFDQLVHCDWRDGTVDVYQAPAGHYLGGEPVFIPASPGEEAAAGVVICQDFDAARRESAFAAAHVGRGPLALVRLPRPIPFGFHASFERARADR
jgi:carotenoid cleavage dioxygenase-like enzyme